jgi:hypothetical protein
MAEDRLVSSAEHGTPQQRRARNRATERDEYAPVKPLPPPRTNPGRDRMPGQARADSLLARQNAMLPVDKVSH